MQLVVSLPPCVLPACATLCLAGAVGAQGVVHPVPEEEIFPADGQFTDSFGTAIDLDADRMIIAAPLVDRIFQGTGAGYVFVRPGGTWVQEAKLQISNGLPDQASEMTVALSGDRAAVGFPKDDADFVDGGSVYVFERVGGIWTQTVRLTPGDLGPRFRFGASIDLEGDTLVVGASGRPVPSLNAGGVYVFARAGGSWIEQAVLVASDAAADDLFGSSLDLDGSTIAVGAPAVDSLTLDTGAVYVFTGIGPAWSQQARLTAPDGGQNDNFGERVGLDGSSLIAGAPFHGSTNCGAAYVFTRTGTAWSQQTKLTNPGCTGNELFGRRVDLDGDLAVVGSRSSFAGPSSGSVTAFVRSGFTWSTGTEFVGPDTSAEDLFGSSINLEGSDLVVGASAGNGAGVRTGTSYEFLLQTGNGSDPGTSLCFGDGSGASCPCGNPGSAGEGCAHSGGFGVRIRAGGSASIAADNLVMIAEQCPVQNAGIFYVGTQNLSPGQVLYDALQCAGGNVRRFRGRIQTTGTVSDTGFVGQEPSGFYFFAGVTYYFQFWTRDASAPSACGTSATLSPAHAVTMTP